MKAILNYNLNQARIKRTIYLYYYEKTVVVRAKTEEFVLIPSVQNKNSFIPLLNISKC